MALLDLDAFRVAPLAQEPFPYLFVPGFVRADDLARIARDFPAVPGGGSFPPSMLRYGPTFRALLAELEGPALRAEVERKFAIDLSGRPTLITVRGFTRAKDGRIHTDTETKLITLLVYLNTNWASPTGRLRLLPSAESLDQPLIEIPPHGGNMVAFRVTANSWHGHEPFVGERRALQLNWVTSQDVVRREHRRHRLSALLKRLRPHAA